MIWHRLRSTRSIHSDPHVAGSRTHNSHDSGAGRSRRVPQARLLWVIALAIGGCALKANLSYAPIAAAPVDSPNAVAVSVVDARAAERGGADGSEIGVVRGGSGNKTPVHADDPDAAVDLMRAAVEDALRMAQITVREDAAHTLVATVTDFWVDGFIGYTTTVTAECALRDERGATLWTSTASGSADAVPWLSATGFMPAAFQQALRDYAQKASTQFDAAEFRQHLGPLPSPTPHVLPTATPRAVSASPAPTADALDNRLRALQQRRERGTITNEEYERYRKQILDEELLQKP
jgi:hypothetical protein